MIEECVSLHSLGTCDKSFYVSLTVMIKCHQFAMISWGPKEQYSGICISWENILVGMQADFPHNRDLKFTVKAVCKF